MQKYHSQLVEISDELVKFKSQGNICIELSEVDSEYGFNEWMPYLCLCCEWFDRAHALAMISAIEKFKLSQEVLH